MTGDQDCYLLLVPVKKSLLLPLPALQAILNFPEEKITHSRGVTKDM